MTELNRDILEQLVEASAEPMFVARIDHPDWPVVLANPAFSTIADYIPVTGKPLADVVESLVGRELALEISETVRAGHWLMVKKFSSCDAVSMASALTISS